MLQLKFDAELAIEVGVEWILQNFPFCLVTVLLFQITKKLLICWSFFSSVLFLFVCLFIHLFFSKRDQIKFHLFPLLGEKFNVGS